MSIDNADPNSKIGLPTRKVDIHIHYGGLKYSAYDYYLFIARVATVYRNILSERYIVIYGHIIVEKIQLNLLKEPLVFQWVRAYLWTHQLNSVRKFLIF